MTTLVSDERAISPPLPPEAWEEWPIRNENSARVKATVRVRNEKYNQEQPEEVYLIRKTNPQFAYKKYEFPGMKKRRKKCIELGSNGKLFFCIQLPRVDGEDGDLVFSEPIQPKFVAVKRLIRTGDGGLEQSIQEGSQDNPYHEIVAMQNFGQVEEDPNKLQHMMNLLEALWDRRYLYIITPVAVEKDLRGNWESCGDFNRLIPWGKGGCSEDEARYCFRSVIENMKYMQKNRLCHRDLKGANIVVKTRGEGSTTLIDFAMSLKVPYSGDTPHLIKGFNDSLSGTRGYLTPEIANGRDFDGYLIDVFALGAILFNLLTGERFLDDFHSRTIPISTDVLLPIWSRDFVFDYFVRNNGLQEDVQIESSLSSTSQLLLQTKIQRVRRLSPQARNLLSGMLKYNIHERFTLYQVSQHEWWQSGGHQRPCCTVS